MSERDEREKEKRRALLRAKLKEIDDAIMQLEVLRQKIKAMDEIQEPLRKERRKATKSPK
jgi:hypothetical protein